MYYREQSFTRWLLVAFAAFNLAACGGGGGTVITANTPAPTASVSTTSTNLVAVTVTSSTLSVGSATAVNAAVTTANGAPVVGATVKFGFGQVGASFGSLNTTSATTNSAGVATVTLTGSAAGSGNVTATYVDPSNLTATNSAPFSVIVGDTILLSAATSSVKSGAGSNNNDTITASVTDPFGGALAGQKVQFSLPSAQQGSFSGSSTQFTDPNGLAKIVFVPSTVNRGIQTVVISASTTSTSGSTSVATTLVNVVGTNIQLSAPETNLLGGTSSTLTATLLDGSGNVIAGQNIVFSASAGLATSPTTVTSDSNGKASVVVTAPTSGAATVSVTASAIGANANYSYTISTSSLVITPASGASLPSSGTCTNIGSASAAPNGYPTICANIPVGASTITVTDTQNGNPAPDGKTQVYLSASLGYFFVPIATDGTGSQGYTPTAATVLTIGKGAGVLPGKGQATIALASQYAGSVTIQAASTDGTQQTAVVDTFLPGLPTKIAAQPAQSVLPTGGQTLVTATVRDVIGNPEPNLRVNFNKLSDDSNGSLSASSTYTDSNGQASVTFTAGGVNGATDGVQIQAALQAYPLVGAGVAKLTVGAQAVDVSIGATNVLTALDPVTYAEPFNVIVTNASGQPVANQLVTLKVYPVAYYKGSYVACGTVWCAEGAPILDQNNNITGYLPRSSCPNEDLNLNGILDTFEDNGKGQFYLPEDYPKVDQISDVIDNHDGKLWPGSPATLSSGTVTTNANGEATFNVIYARSYGNWLSLKLVATTVVAGSESTTDRVFDTSILASDAALTGSPPGGINSPFGVKTDCRNPL